MLQKMMVLGTLDGAAPMEILNHWGFDIRGSEHNEAADFVESLGLPQLGYTLSVLGVWVGIIVIISGLLMLAIVQYPKTVAQTKTRIAVALIGVGLIAISPYLFDVVGSLIVDNILSAGGTRF